MNNYIKYNLLYNAVENGFKDIYHIYKIYYADSMSISTFCNATFDRWMFLNKMTRIQINYLFNSPIFQTGHYAISIKQQYIKIIIKKFNKWQQEQFLP
jgi:hypothetical protein